ncbi:MULTISPECIES: hypothetical protein [Arthrobacter]|uniref:ABM domain-containing protein n=2 Tax=Arthrobacter TaxID=1663 RepID=A0ABU9KR44_9MICC|nr:hypothetical protein [Arthrobacter sp. YJM1]MDP5228539.1 hypothetical protein [Arthrobacter sp. YJM1]
MTTLHIEHAVTDFETWHSAFERFAPARTEAGVLEYTIRRPSDDPAYVLIDLEFSDEAHAAGFLEFLRTRVWTTRDNSPALVGTAHTRLLETVHTG